MENGEKFEGEKISISDALPKDAAGLRSVEYETWLDTYADKGTGITREDIQWYFNDFKKSFSDRAIVGTAEELRAMPENEKALVIKDGDAVVGYAWCVKHSESNELGAIYVLPTYQGLGLARKMWGKISEYFGTGKDIFLTVQAANKKAIDFYKSLGFVEAGSIPSQLTFPSGVKFEEIKMILPAESGEAGA
ncbi:MAG: Acetyltransferase, GNAT [Parcubacteria group bacterium LiPW_15]|nr:MAG: Acetyltransferase, GNAT [Parcubacteria group bacterium LiPW_15]